MKPIDVDYDYEVPFYRISNTAGGYSWDADLIDFATDWTDPSGIKVGDRVVLGLAQLGSVKGHGEGRASADVRGDVDISHYGNLGALLAQDLFTEEFFEELDELAEAIENNGIGNDAAAGEVTLADAKAVQTLLGDVATILGNTTEYTAKNTDGDATAAVAARQPWTP